MLDPETFRAILEILPHGVYVVDRERRLLFWNEGAEKITGYRSQEVIGRCCQDDLLMHCDTHGRVLCGSGCPLLATMHDGKPREAELLLRHRDGERVPVRVIAKALRDAHGAIVGAVESFDEPYPRVEADGLQVANPGPGEDQLTGLLLRHGVEMHLAGAVEDFNSENIPCAVFSMEIDRLDQFQHSYGVLASEALIRSAAHTIARNLPLGGRAGRFAPERFVAVLRGCPESDAAEAAEQLRQMVGCAAISWWGDRLSSTLSVGVTWARTGDDAESLLSRSEDALQRCLQKGGDRVILA
jgi:PAS domain S-box-containing protein/diguanylate cyclase (GGDEF)-like protein